MVQLLVPPFRPSRSPTAGAPSRGRTYGATGAPVALASPRQRAALIIVGDMYGDMGIYSRSEQGGVSTKKP